MTVREATRADLPALLHIEQGSFGVDAWTPGQVEEELGRPGGRLLVAEEHGGVVGFLAVVVVLGELDVLQIAVDPAARRRGVGRALLAAMWDAAPHADVALLEVRADNTAAIALYVDSGWRPVGRRPRYYADACDALLFRLARPAPP